MKPNFLVVGAAKAGSTTLCAALAQHPDVFFPERKELHFFSFDATHARGASWYERWFEGSDDCAARGEGSTTYSGRTVFPEAAPRIARYEPAMKLIYIVREPVSRIESVWMQLRRFGAQSPFGAVGLHEVPEALRVDADFDRAVRLQRAALVDSSNYWKELQHLGRFFPERQIHVVFLEELRADPEATLADCFAFLGVDPGRAESLPLPNLNAATEARYPHPFLVWLWSSSRRRRAYGALARRVPVGVRRRLNEWFLRRSFEGRPQWSPETRAWVDGQLRSDSLRLLEHYGRSPALWGLEPGSNPSAPSSPKPSST